MAGKHVAILFSDNSSSGFTHDFFAPILNNFKVTMERAGYFVSFFNNDPSYLKDTDFEEQIKKYGIDGVFILNISEVTDMFLRLLKSDIPIVTLDHKTPGAVSITSDNISGVKNLVDYVFEMGHRKIAYMVGDSNNEVSKLRLDTFKAECESLGLRINPDYIKLCKFRDMKAASRLTEEFLAMPDPPTCLFYPDDYAAVGGMNIIRARGLEVPNDISYCGYDGIQMVSFFEPSITTVRQDQSKMGQLAAEKMIDLIEGRCECDGSEIMVDSCLIKGHTVAHLY